MGKIKTKQLPIEWEENSKGHLVGTISENGPSLTTLENEIMDMPIDVPGLKKKDVTIDILIKFPKNFSENRKNDLFDSVKEMYSGWKVELKPEGIFIIPDLDVERDY